MGKISDAVGGLWGLSVQTGSFPREHQGAPLPRLGACFGKNRCRDDGVSTVLVGEGLVSRYERLAPTSPRGTTYGVSPHLVGSRSCKQLRLLLPLRTPRAHHPKRHDRWVPTAKLFAAPPGAEAFRCTARCRSFPLHRQVPKLSVAPLISRSR